MLRPLDIKYIVLDTRTPVSRLRNDIKILSKFDADEERILKLIFEHLVNENSAELGIGYECLMIVDANLNKKWTNDIVRLTNGVVILGNILLKELQRLKAYENGMLNYDFHKLLDADIVLRKRKRI